MRPGTPIIGADLQNRSPWFNAETHPVHVGWYECRYWSDRNRRWALEVPRWWDGQCWCFAEDGPASDFASRPRDQWRGRKAPS